MRENKVIGNALLLIIMTLISRITGFLREIALAYCFGASEISDAYTIGTSLPTVIFTGLGSALLISYIPVAGRIKDEKERAVFTSNIANLLILLTSLLCILLYFNLDAVLSVFAVGFSGQVLAEAKIIAQTTVIVAPALVFINLSLGYLHLYNCFWMDGVQGIMTNLLLCASIFCAFNNSFLLGIGYSISYILPALFLMVYIRRHRFQYYFCVSVKDGRIKELLFMTVPVLIGQVIAQINGTIDRSFASTLGEGVISCMKYANLICIMTSSLFSTSIGTVIYPRLAGLGMEKNDRALLQLTRKTLFASISLIIPVIVMMFCFSEPIIMIVFQRGAFTAQDTVLTAEILSIYSFSLLGNAAGEIMNKLFYSKKDSITPVICYSAGMICNIILNTILIKRMGYYGLALATSAGTWFSMFLLFFFAKFKIQGFKLRLLLADFIKNLTAAAGMILAVSVYNQVFFVCEKKVQCLFHLAVSFLLGIIVYGGILLGIRAGSWGKKSV